MPTLYSKITSNSKPDTYHNQDKYAPDVIFVFLGINDYNNLIKPSQNNFVYGY
jgi:lysophospholipase L1-like esterase